MNSIRALPGIGLPVTDLAKAGDFAKAAEAPTVCREDRRRETFVEGRRARRHRDTTPHHRCRRLADRVSHRPVGRPRRVAVDTLGSRTTHGSGCRWSRIGLSGSYHSGRQYKHFSWRFLTVGLRGPRPQRVALGTVLKGDVAGRPEMPDFVVADPVAAECFDTVCDHLERLGTLRPEHAMALGILAGEWSRYIVASEISRREPIVTGGSGGPKTNPAAAVASSAAKQVVDVLGKFGLTLASLGTVTVPAGARSGSSSLQAFLDRRSAKIAPTG